MLTHSSLFISVVPGVMKFSAFDIWCMLAEASGAAYVDKASSAASQACDPKGTASTGQPPWFA